MKKSAFIILMLVTVFYLTGCAKKQEVIEEMQEPLSMEELSALESKTQATAETKAHLEPLSLPAGPYKPNAREIQTALKNAGYYNAVIDGRIGPQTKKAIEDFQKANGLEADGKVGTKTWSVLSSHLNPPIESQKVKKKQ